MRPTASSRSQRVRSERTLWSIQRRALLRSGYLTVRSGANDPKPRISTESKTMLTGASAAHRTALSAASRRQGRSRGQERHVAEPHAWPSRMRAIVQYGLPCPYDAAGYHAAGMHSRAYGRQQILSPLRTHTHSCAASTACAHPVPLRPCAAQAHAETALNPTALQRQRRRGGAPVGYSADTSSISASAAAFVSASSPPTCSAYACMPARPHVAATSGNGQR